MRTTTGRTAVRQRKLNPKAGQAILREDQIEEYDALQNPQGKHVTGVEVRASRDIFNMEPQTDAPKRKVNWASYIFRLR